MTTEETRQQTRILVQAAAEVCEEKKGEDTRILELDPVDAGLSDFFLITSATNNRQSIAIADEIEYRIKTEFGVYPNSTEGRRLGEWILLDYVDFVVHVFLAERRAFYDIERLRKSARPLTPAEFDDELKVALATKTLDVRKKASAKPKKVAAKAPVAVKQKTAAAEPKAAVVAAKPKKVAKKAAVVAAPAAKKAAKKLPVAAKPAAKKAVAAKPAAKKAVAKKVIVKKTVAKKATPKKAVVAKVAVKKAPAKKAVAKKTAPKKVVVKKAAAKKPVAKKTAVKKSATKKKR
jgi:ribosome-associated protein